MQKTCCFIPVIISLLLISPVWARTMSIGKDKANVYSGPGLEHAVVYQAPVGYPLRIEVEIGDWLRFRDWLGNIGWVTRPSVSGVKSAIVSVRIAAISSAPDIFHRTGKTVNRGEIYKVLEERPNWVRVGSWSNGESIGWIQEDLVFGE